MIIRAIHRPVVERRLLTAWQCTLRQAAVLRKRPTSSSALCHKRRRERTASTAACSLRVEIIRESVLIVVPTSPGATTTSQGFPRARSATVFEPSMHGTRIAPLTRQKDSVSEQWALAEKSHPQDTVLVSTFWTARSICESR